jgi:hypothetical protein
VPIFVPEWWPHSYYNVRYGLQLLPAIIVSCALLVDCFPKWHLTVAAIVACSLAAGIFSEWRATPICLREARVNARTRMAFEREIADILQILPSQERLMMYTGDHVGALQRAGIPLKRVLNEGDWPKWDDAMNSPEAYADVLIAIQGDPVAACAARNRNKLQSLAVIHSEGQPPATIYRMRR